MLNEAALIEGFVRHHAGLLDLHMVLDNGSTDDTLPILRRLHAEGLALQVYQAVSPVYAQAVHANGLYRVALQEGADWVAFLDCDELLDARRTRHGLHQWLAALPAELACVRLPMFDHLAPSAASGAAPLVFERLVRRQPASQAAKVMVRGLPQAAVSIGAGAHAAIIDGKPHQGAPQDDVVLAHYPQRSPAQMALKAIIGRLKVIADGQANAHLNHNWHYIEPVEALKHAPRRWLAEAARHGLDQPGLVDEPSPYRGGTLRYTAIPDDDARLVALLLTYAEQLAQSHGALLDRSPALRTAVLEQGARARRLL